jgi:hypothetical protein
MDLTDGEFGGSGQASPQTQIWTCSDDNNNQVWTTNDNGQRRRSRFPKRLKGKICTKSQLEAQRGHYFHLVC